MTYATEKVSAGRQPVTFLELDLDYCQESYGVGACTAGQVAGDTAQAGAATSITLAAADTQADDYYNTMVIKITGGTGSGQEKTITDYVNATKVATVNSAWTTNPDATSTYTIHNVNSSAACYNTRRQCQDPTNYNNGTKTRRFVQPRGNLPIGVACFPVLDDKSPSIAAAKITPGKGLGDRASVTVALHDYVHNDIGEDPYRANRTYDTSQGTYFTKLIARNPYMTGRVMRLRTGYITDPFDWANFQSRTYIIDKVEGPDASGRIRITGKDPLKLADNDRAKVPAPSTGELLADITAGASSATLTPTGVGNDEYGASGTLRIGDELITYTRSGDTLTLTARGANGTTATTHSAGDTVQDCVVFAAGTNAVSVVNTLLTTYAPGFDSAWINTTDWDAERDLWLSGATIAEVVLSKPEGVNKLVSEITEQFLFDLWWDDVNQEVKLAALAPLPGNATPTQLTDAGNLLEGSISIKRDEKDVLTECWVHYGVISQVEDLDAKNFTNTYIQALVDEEGADKRNTKRIKEVFSRWIPAQGNAAQFTGRTLARYGNDPITIIARLDVRDDALMLGDPCEITTRRLVDETGAAVATGFQVVKVDQTQPGHEISITVMNNGFTGSYGFIMENSAPDRASATEAQKTTGGYIAANDGTFSNGDTAQKIL